MLRSSVSAFRLSIALHSGTADRQPYLNEAQHTAVVCTRVTERRTLPSAVQYFFVLYDAQLLLYASTYAPPASVFVSVQVLVRPPAFPKGHLLEA